MELKTRFDASETQQVAVFELAGFVGDQDIAVQARFVARIAILDAPLSLAATQTGMDTPDSFALVVEQYVGMNLTSGIFTANQQFCAPQAERLPTFQKNEVRLRLSRRNLSANLLLKLFKSEYIVRRRLKALVRGLGQCFGDKRIHFWRKVRAQPTDRGNRITRVHQDNVKRTTDSVRGISGEHLEQNDGQGVKVGPRIDRV